MAAMTNASSKYKAIISKSYEIRKGSPTIYQLRPKKENIGTLTKINFGVKDPKKANKTILLVGETGSGKSTMINALVNFAMGVKWEDDVWFQIVEDEKKEQSFSQTSDVIVYNIFGHEDKTLPYSLTIIDTPGYGDTGGLEHDEIVRQRLFDLFRSKNGVHEIDAVGLVLKAGENRLSDRLAYIFNSVVSLFGKDLENNMVALLTHSPGGTPKNALEALNAANIKCARNDRNQPIHFLFNNCQSEARKEELDDLQYSYNKAMKGMEKFTDFLQTTSPQKLETTVRVLNERIGLTACVQNLKERVESVKIKLDEINQTRLGLQKYQEAMKSYEGFTMEVDQPYKDKEKVVGKWGALFFVGAVTCKVCEENCHFPGCTVARSPSGCEVMKDGRCTSCTNRCPVEDHVKENWRYVTKTKKVTITLQDVKFHYEKNKAQARMKMNILENLEKEMENLERRKTQFLDESFNHVVKLEKIALNVSSVSTYVHLDFLIEEMEKKNDTRKVQKLKDMSSRKDRGVLAGVQYLYRALLGKKVK